MGEIAFGGLELGLGLLDVRRFRRQPSEGAIDVALFFERLDHLFRRLLERMDDAQLSRALDQVRLRLEHGRKGLIEIGRNLAEISPLGLRRQTQRDTDLMDIGQRRDNVRARRQQSRLPPVVLRPGDIARHHQLGGPIEIELSQRELGLALVESGDPGAQQGHLVVDVLIGVLQFPTLAPGVRFDAARPGRRHSQLCRRRIDGRLFDRDCDLKGLFVQLDEKVSLVHAVVVVDEDARYLASDACGHERDVTVDVCVIRRNRVERRLDPGNAEPKGGGQDQNAQRPDQQPSSPRGSLILRRAPHCRASCSPDAL